MFLKKNPESLCVVGLSTEAERLSEIRKNRMNSLKETENKSYTDLDKVKKEVQEAKNTFKKYKWPMIDVTRKSVEETAASIIKIHEIYKKNGWNNPCFKSKVRKEILDKNEILNRVEPSNVDEDLVKESLLKERATPTIISKNLAELKANKVSLKNFDILVLGADSVIDLEGELISKPRNREEALDILKKLNGKNIILLVLYAFL